MEKKLKAWQIALLIIFYPIGILYLIVKYGSKKSDSADKNSALATVSTSQAETQRKDAKSELIVFVTEKGKVYHLDPVCANSFADDITEKQAIKRGLCRCKKCFAHYNK